MIKNEIIKLFTNKFLISTFVILLLVQIGLVSWTQYDNENKTGISSDAYNEITTDIMKIPEDEVVEYLYSKIEYLETIRYVMIFVMSDIPLDSLEIENVENVLQTYEAGSYLTYTDNVESELALYKEVYEEYSEVYSYNTTVNSILENTERYINSSRTDKTSFDYYRALKTNQKYQKLSEINPDYVPSKGIDFYLKYEITDFLVLAFMMFATVVIVTMEREKGLSLLSKTTRFGGITHSLVKIISLGIVCGLVTIIMNVVLFLATNIYYPISEFNNPIQAVSGYTYCSLRVSIGQFIGISVLMKILFYFSVTCIFYFLCCGFRNCIPVYFISVVIVVVATFLSNAISPTSYIAWINNYNMFTYRNVAEILKRYTCIEIGGMAVDKISFVIGYLLLICIICIVAGVTLYILMEEREKKTIQSITVNKRNRLHTNMFFHEIYKVFVSQGGALLFLVALLIAYFTFNPVKSINYSLGEVMYDYNTEEIQGKYTDISFEYITDYKANIECKIDKKYDTATYSEKLIMDAEKIASEMMENYGQYLSEKNNSYFINNDGYIALTYGNNEINQQNAIKMMLVAVISGLLFITVMAVDYQNGEEKLIHTTVFGGRKYIIYKILIGVVIAIIIFGIFWIPELIGTLKSYGTEYIDVPAYSMRHLEGVSQWISIKIYITLCYFVRFLLICGIMAISYVINIKVRSKAVSVIMVWIITIIPMIMYMSLH